GLAPGANRVSEAALLAQLLEQARRHAAADSLDEDRQRRQPRVGCRHPRQGERPMRLLELTAVITDAARELGASDRHARPILHIAKQLLGAVQHRTWIDLATGGEDQPRGNELSLNPVQAIVARGGSKSFLTAEHRAAKRLAVERSFEQMLMNEIVRRVVDLAKLRQDDLLLALEMLLGEVWGA